MSGLFKSINLKKLSDVPASDEFVNRRHKPDYKIVLSMVILMLIGLIVIYAIGPARANVLNHAYGSDYSSNYFFVKQLASLIIAVSAFVAVSLIPYKWFLSRARAILVIGLLASGILAVSGWLNAPFAQCSLGACRWYDLGPLGSFQPAEILKFGLVLYLASFLAAKIAINKLDDKEETIIPFLVLSGISLFLVIILQKDMGTGVAIGGIIAATLVVSGMKWKTLAGLAGLAALAMTLMIVMAPHRMERVATYFHGENATLEGADNYHVEHAKTALGTGGFAGVGVGNSVQATGYLPEAINDSVFAIIGEMFGFLGVVVIITIFAILMLRILKTIDYLPDMRLKLIVAGVFGWFAAHVILNIASMIGLIPLTGITLPFLSFGGTSLIFIAASLGLVFQLSHYTMHPSRLKEVSNENTSGRRGLRGPRHSSNRRTHRD